MPKNTAFRTSWLLILDNTGKACSRWLTKGTSKSSFRCTIRGNDELSYANGGWIDVRKHYERPKHIQNIKDVFGSVALISTNHRSSSLSSNVNSNDVCIAASSSTTNASTNSFVTIQNGQRALTHEDSEFSKFTFFRKIFLSIS